MLTELGANATESEGKNARGTRSRKTIANIKVKPPNFIQVGVGIVKKESFLALYKGLGGRIS